MPRFLPRPRGGEITLAHEHYLTAIKNSIENGAADLATLVKSVNQRPEPEPTLRALRQGQDHFALAASIMNTMADDTAQFVTRLDGKPARVQEMPADTERGVLLDLIARHQTCISGDLKAILKLYRQPAAPD